MNAERDSGSDRAGRIVSIAFSRVQDVVYAFLGLLLSLSAFALLACGGIGLARAAVRRILVITAEFGAQARPNEIQFQQVMWELGLLTVLILALVASVVILRRNDAR